MAQAHVSVSTRLCTKQNQQAPHKQTRNYARGPGVKERTKLQVKETGLADVLELGAGLANLCLLEPHPTARAPAEHRERAIADLASLFQSNPSRGGGKRGSEGKGTKEDEGNAGGGGSS